MDIGPIIDALQLDNPARPRGILIYLADQLRAWWEARIDIAVRGQIGQDGKPNPSLKIQREAASVIWGKAHNLINKEGAVKYLEENHGVAERDGEEKGVGGHEVPGDVCAVDLRGRGVEPPLDRGSAVDVPRLGGDQGPHRKGYKRKVPARLRT